MEKEKQISNVIECHLDYMRWPHVMFVFTARSVSRYKWVYLWACVIPYALNGSIKLTAHKHKIAQKIPRMRVSERVNDKIWVRWSDIRWHTHTHPYKKWHLNLQLPFRDLMLPPRLPTKSNVYLLLFISYIYLLIPFKWHIWWINRLWMRCKLMLAHANTCLSVCGVVCADTRRLIA